MDQGYIKLWRKFEKWEWFDNSKMVHLFLFLLMRATHENTNYHGYEIKRGQVVFGLRSASQVTKISVRSLRTLLNKLKSTHEITHQTTHDFSIITLLNYDSYQSNKKSNDTQINTPNDNQSTSHRQAIDTIQEVKNVKNKDISSPTGSVIHTNRFEKPSIDNLRLAFESANIYNPQVEAEKFFNFYESKGWLVGKSPMKSWKHAVLNWAKNKQTIPTQEKQHQRLILQ